MKRADMRGKIQSVLGLVEPESLGPTLMHEHLLCDSASPSTRACCCEWEPITLENVWEINHQKRRHRPNSLLDMIDVAVDEVTRMRDEGGRAIVELTNGGLEPNPDRLRTISERTGVTVIMGCGHYVEEYQDASNFERSVEDFAKEMVDQVFEGAWGTDVRAGIIGEIGCQAPWTPLERRVMSGAILAQQETGAALNVHPGRDPDQPQEVVDFIRKEGGDVGRTIISHVDRTIFDHDRLLRLADSGCVVELDLFGMEQTFYPFTDIDLPNDGQRLKLLRLLIDRGHGDRIVISHDICLRTRLVTFGGHGYGHIFRNVVPLMPSRGFDQQEIEAILVDTPRRLLTLA